MTCGNQNSGDDFGKTFSQVTTKDFEDTSLNHDHAMNINIEHIVESITSKCKSLGCTLEASQDARNVSLL